MIADMISGQTPFKSTNLVDQFTLDMGEIGKMLNWRTPKQRYHTKRAKELLEIADACILAYRGGINSASSLCEALKSWQNTYTTSQGNFYK